MSAERQATPVSNRGAQRTSGEGKGPDGMTALVDWLGFTLHGAVEWAVAVAMPSDAADFEKWQEVLDPDGLPRGGLGYRRRAELGHIRVYWDGNGGTVHFEVSGQGVRELEAHGVSDWTGFLSHLLHVGGSMTRLDLALDSKGDGALDMDRVWTAIQSGEYVARASRTDSVQGSGMSLWESRRTRAAEPGRTVYIGAPSSRARVRIYDKRQERIAKGEADPGPWVRCELQLRDERAQAMAAAIAEQPARDPREQMTFQELAASALAGLVDFVEPTRDTNKRRAKRAAWWDAFLRGVKRLRLATQAVKRTIEDVERWIRDAVAPNLALLLDVRGQSSDYLTELLVRGRYRWKAKHRDMLAEAGAVV